MIKVADEGSNRYTATAKISSQWTNWMKFNYSLRFVRKDYHRPQSLGSSVYEYLGGQWPCVPLYDRNGNLARFTTDTSDVKHEYQNYHGETKDGNFADKGYVYFTIKDFEKGVDNYHKERSDVTSVSESASTLKSESESLSQPAQNKAATHKASLRLYFLIDILFSFSHNIPLKRKICKRINPKLWTNCK